MFKKILVPLDGSAAAEHALDSAAYLAGLNQGEVVLMRAAPPPITAGDYNALIIDPDVFGAEQCEACLSYLEQQATRLRHQGCAKVSTDVVQFYAPAEAVLEAVREHTPDVVVMTSHGRSGVKRLLLGSVAETLARSAPCPVFIVGHNAVKERRAAEALKTNGSV